jgi:hypothetical protein
MESTFCRTVSNLVFGNLVFGNLVFGNLVFGNLVFGNLGFDKSNRSPLFPSMYVHTFTPHVLEMG